MLCIVIYFVFFVGMHYFQFVSNTFWDDSTLQLKDSNSHKVCSVYVFFRLVYHLSCPSWQYFSSRFWSSYVFHYFFFPCVILLPLCFCHCLVALSGQQSTRIRAVSDNASPSPGSVSPSPSPLVMSSLFLSWIWPRKATRKIVLHKKRETWSPLLVMHSSRNSQENRKWFKMETQVWPYFVIVIIHLFCLKQLSFVTEVLRYLRASCLFAPRLRRRWNGDAWHEWDQHRQFLRVF